jgi:hypothetical protein
MSLRAGGELMYGFDSSGPSRVGVEGRDAVIPENSEKILVEASV